MEASSSTLTAVVISYNSASDLPGCVAGLVRAGVPVLVVDNASRDSSARVARGLGYQRLEVLELGHNTGFAGGCNRGFGAAPADVPYLAFMNSDVVVQPGCLERCVEVLDERPEVAAVAPRLMRPDGATVDSVGQVLRAPTLEVRDRGYGGPLDPELLQPRQVLAACGALGVFRRTALEQVAEEQGPWAEHFFCFWEDLELGWRMTNRCLEVWTEPRAVAIHTRGAGAAAGPGPLRWRRPPELEACVITNRWMTLLRHLHPIDAELHAPVLLPWDLGLVTLGVIRRPRLAGHLRRRWPLVYREWRRRGPHPRRRLVDLPW